MPMNKKEKLAQLIRELADYVQYASDALEKSDFDEVESSLAMLADDAGKALGIVEELVDNKDLS